MDAAYRLISAFFESIDAGRRLLASEPNLIEARTGLGETPLHYLAVEDQLDAVRVLVESGANVNTVSNVGGTPLSEAALLGYAELVTYLLSVGARLSIEGQSELVLHQAAASRSLETARALLRAGADINAQNEIGETPLHVAAWKNDVEMVRLLVEAGADINARCIFDETPLEVAQKNGSTAVADELRSSSGDR